MQTQSQQAQYVLRATEKYTGFFPFKAVRIASDIRDELIPELINRVNFAVEQGVNLSETYMGHLYALFLLAEFRAEESYDAVLRVFYLDEDALECILGDAITENLGSITASIAQDRYVELLSILENRELYQYARTAALSAIEIQMHHGLLDKAAMEKRLGEVLSRAIDNEDMIVATALASTVSDLKLMSLVEMIRKAFDHKLIDPTMMDLNWFEKSLKEKSDFGKYHQEQLISTAGESMSDWPCFKQEGADKIQRNEPCPCSSGLKYKKCCLVYKFTKA